MRRLVALCALLAFGSVLAGCANDDEIEAPTITRLVQEDGRFSRLAIALQATGLQVALRQSGPFTLFAPTDQAFARLPASTLDALIADPAQLDRILRFHVVPGRFTTADLRGLSSLGTLLGPHFAITSTQMDTLVLGSAFGDALLIRPDFGVANGIIHTIDNVLFPPSGL